MSYSVTIDVFRENYLRVITEAFQCLSDSVMCFATGDKTRAIGIKTKVEQLLDVLASAPHEDPFIEMKVTLGKLKDQLTDFINLNLDGN